MQGIKRRSAESPPIVRPGLGLSAGACLLQILLAITMGLAGSHASGADAGKPTLQDRGDFEVARALDAYSLGWSLLAKPSDRPNWTIDRKTTHDRIDSLRSGDVGRNGQCRVSAKIIGPLKLSFWWKVTSTRGTDRLAFLVDETHLKTISGTDSGGVDWLPVSHDVPNGQHEIAWLYYKDGSADSDGDAGWIDQIVLSAPPTLKAEVVRPANPEVENWVVRAAVVPNRFYRLRACSEGKSVPVTRPIWTNQKSVEFQELPAFAKVRQGAYQVEMVEPPSFVGLPPATEDGVVGKPLTLSARADGADEMKYQWYHQAIGKEDKPPHELKGQTGKTLSLPQFRPEDAGKYSVKASNPAGDETSPACDVTAQFPPHEIRLSVSPEGSLPVGGEVTLTATALTVTGKAVGDDPSYQWRKEGDVITKAQGNTLHLAKLKATDTGKYSVSAKNKWGDAVSSEVHVKVVPPIVFEPAPKDLAVYVGDYVVLHFPVQGNGEYRYCWYKDNELVNGADQPTFTCDTSKPTSKPTSEPTTVEYRTMAIRSSPEDKKLSDKITVKIHDLVPYKADSADIDLIPVPAGEFEMGSLEAEDEGPVRTVRVSRAFWIGKTEITRRQWQKLLPREGSAPSADEADLPARCSHAEATRFCSELTAREKAANRLDNGYEFSLPTEAQWERAARLALPKTGFAEVAWLASANPAVATSVMPVGKKKPDSLGLHDLFGNVWEWTNDVYAAPYEATRTFDPTGPRAGPYRVLRGGSANIVADCYRLTLRYYDYPDSERGSYGFRVVKRRTDSIAGYQLDTQRPKE